MNRLTIILAGLALCLAGPAQAMDLGWAGALSGAGNGMSSAASQMQNAIIQQELMRQQAEAQQRREEQQERWQREREERARVWQQEQEAQAARWQQEQATRDRRTQQEQNRPPVASHTPVATQPVLGQQAIEEERLRKWRENDPPTPAAITLHATPDPIGDERLRKEREESQPARSYQSRLAAYQQLMIEQHWLDQEKERLAHEADSPEHQHAITAYNQNVREYSTRLTAFDQRKHNGREVQRELIAVGTARDGGTK